MFAGICLIIMSGSCLAAIAGLLFNRIKPKKMNKSMDLDLFRPKPKTAQRCRPCSLSSLFQPQNNIRRYVVKFAQRNQMPDR